jgi:hypothetical protein
MSAIPRKSKKEQQSESSEAPEIIEIPLPQPKKKGSGSSKQESVPVVVDDDSTPSVAVAAEPKPSKKEKGSSKQKEETPEVVDDDSTPSVAVEVEQKPSKKGKSSASKQKEETPEVVDDDSTLSVAVEVEQKSSKKGKSSASKPEEPVESESVEPAPKKGKEKKMETPTESGDQSEVVKKEKTKKQPSKSLVEQMTDSVETLNNQVEKMNVLIKLKEAFLKHLTPLIASRKKELKEQNVDDESEETIFQFLDKQKKSLNDEIAMLKSLVRDLSSVSKLNEKATKHLDSKKKKSDEDTSESEPKKPRNQTPSVVSTKEMNNFIENNYTLEYSDGTKIFEQKPEKNSDGNFLVEKTKLTKLIHEYITNKSLRNGGRIILNDELKPLFSKFLGGDFSKEVKNTSIFSVLSHNLEKKA